MNISFKNIDVLASGFRVLVGGEPGEVVQLTALRPVQATGIVKGTREATEWVVLVEQVVLGKAGSGTVTFGTSASPAK